MEGLEAKSCSSLAPKLQSFQGTLGGAAPGFVGEADQFLAGFGRCGDPLAEGNAQSLPAKDEIAALWIYARHPPRAMLGAGIGGVAAGSSCRLQSCMASLTWLT